MRLRAKIGFLSAYGNERDWKYTAALLFRFYNEIISRLQLTSKSEMALASVQNITWNTQLLFEINWC